VNRFSVQTSLLRNNWTYLLSYVVIQHENHRLLLMELQAYRLYWTLA
jgi:hypothetical protein